jgi:hypothetical protein
VGRLVLTVSIRAEGDDVTVSSGVAACGSLAPVQTLSFEIHSGAIVTTSVEPDQDALGQAAYAKVFERV